MRTWTRTARWRRYSGLLFVLPWLIGLLAFELVPSIATLVISLTRWDLANAPEWVGLRHYSTLIGDEVLGQSDLPPVFVPRAMLVGA